MYVPRSDTLDGENFIAIFHHDGSQLLGLKFTPPHGLAIDGNFGPTLGPVDFLFPRDRWVCVELTLHLDAVAGSATIRVDDQVVASFVNTPTVGPDNNKVGLGSRITPTTATGAFDLYFDEVVIAASATPVGCH
jgi:hypothetical protein